MKKIFNSFTIFYILILITPLSYYFFIYIPQNEEYFVDRAQREIKELTLNFQKMLDNSSKIHKNLLSGSKLDKNYISETLDAKFIFNNYASSQKLNINIKSNHEIEFKEKLNNGETIVYTKSLNFLKNITPDYFCDLFFLDKNFNSLYIKDNSKTRINNIESVLGDSVIKSKRLNSIFKKIMVAEEGFLLFLYPIDNDEINVDYLIGLMKLDEFEKSVYRISNNTKLFFIVFILISIICWPILKLKFSSNYDGISKAERILLFFSIIVVVMFFTIIVLDYYFYQSKNIIRDQNLEKLNEVVHENLNEELIQIDSTITILSRNRKTLPTTNIHQLYPERNIPVYPKSYFRLNQNGEQEKWTIQNKIKLSDPRILSEREYFKYFKEKEFYYLEKDKNLKLKKDFFLQNLTSLSTGKDELVVARADLETNSNYVEAITTSLFTFNDIPLPKNYSYILINDKGKAIFYSSKQRHLSENFVLESANNSTLKSAIQNQAKTTINLRYQGEDIRAYIQPFLSSYINQEWFLITLYEKDRQHIINASLIVKTVAAYIVLLISLFLMKFIYLFVFTLIQSFLEKKKTDGLSFYRIKEINNFINFSWLSPHSNLQSTSFFLITLNLATFTLIAILNYIFSFSLVTFLTVCAMSISFVEILNYFICSIPDNYLNRFRFFKKKRYNQSYYHGFIWSFVVLIVIFPLCTIFIQIHGYLNINENISNHIEIHKRFSKQYDDYYQRYSNIIDKKKIKSFIDAQVAEQLKHNQKVLSALGHSFIVIKQDSLEFPRLERDINIQEISKPDHRFLSLFTVQRNQVIESIQETSNRVDSVNIRILNKREPTLQSSSHIPNLENELIFLGTAKTPLSLKGYRVYSFIFMIIIFMFLAFRLIRFLVNSLFIRGLVLSDSKVSKKFVYLKNEFIETEMDDYLKKTNYISFDFCNDTLANWDLSKTKDKTILIENIDMDNENEESNNRVLETIQKVIAQKPKKIIVHTRLHPLVHFNLSENYKRSWQRLFSQFQYGYLPETLDKGLSEMNLEGKFYFERKEIISECSSFQFTFKFLWDEDLKGLLFEQGLETVKDKLYWYSFHFYKSLWDQCTMEEKVILYNYSNDDILKKQKNVHIINLIHKGLLKKTFYNQYDVFSESFECFVRENFDRSVKDVFLENDTSLWQTIKIPFIFLILVLAVFLFSTQRELMDQAISIIAGFAAGVPLLFNIFKIFKPVKAITES